MNIPKIIHQIWLGPYKRPDIWMNSWKIDYIKENNDWKYKLWTEKEIKKLNLINKEFYEKEEYYNGKSDIVNVSTVSTIPDALNDDFSDSERKKYSSGAISTEFVSFSFIKYKLVLGTAPVSFKYFFEPSGST